MAATLKATIELEGANAILKQLEGLGKAGEKAFVDIKNAADKVGGFDKLKTDEVRQKLRSVGLEGEEAFNKIRGAVDTAVRVERLLNALNLIERGFAGIGNAALAVVRSLTPLGLALGAVGAAAAAAGAALVNSSVGAAKAANEVSLSAIKFGTTLKQYQDLRAGFNQAGIATQTFSQAMGELQKNLEPAAIAQIKQLADTLVALKQRGITDPAGFQRLAAAATGTGEAAKIAQEALKKLGGTALQFQALPQITDLTDALSKLGVQATDSSGKLRTIAQAAPEVITKLAQMKDGPERTRLAIKALGETAGVELIQALRLGGQAVIDFNNKYRSAGLEITASQEAMAPRVVAAYNRVQAAVQRFNEQPSFFSPAAIASLQAAEETIKRISIFLGDPSFANFGAIFVPTFELIKQGASIAFEFVKTKAGEMFAAVSNAVTTPVAQAWLWVVTAFQIMLDDLIAGALQAAAFIKRLLTESPAGAGPSLSDTGDISGNWRGGLIGGKGTGTSDSNLAWVSKGEHIQPASVVRQPGVLAFLEELRRSGGNLRRVMAGFRGFNLGGLVGDVAGSLRPLRAMPIPAFAGGGAVGGLHPVTINFAGQSIGGLLARPDTVDELRKAAVLAQTRSAGPKPSRY